jgi:hypothetical protein
MTTEEYDQRRIRNGLHPVEIFIAFFLVGPLLGALLLVVVHNLMLLIWGYHIFELWERDLKPVLGLAIIDAMLAYFFALPAGFLVAVCAVSSFFVFRRVSLIVVLAAALAAIGLENAVQYYADIGLMALGENIDGVILLQLLIHLVPATICWVLVRNERPR